MNAGKFAVDDGARILLASRGRHGPSLEPVLGDQAVGAVSGVDCPSQS